MSAAHPGNQLRLTPTEQYCLMAEEAGMTAREIAEMLGVRDCHGPLDVAHQKQRAVAVDPRLKIGHTSLSKAHGEIHMNKDL